MSRTTMRLLWHALFFRLLVSQKRLFAFAVLTVSLGVALALGIRLGTESATRSLETTLPLTSHSGWSEPMTARGAQAIVFLREQALRQPSQMFSVIETQALRKGLIGDQQVSLQLIFPWSGAPETTPTTCKSEFSLFQSVRLGGKNFRLPLIAAGDFQQGQQQCRIAIIDLQAESLNAEISSALNDELERAPLKVIFRTRDESERLAVNELKQFAQHIPGIEIDTDQQRIERLKDVTRSFRTNLQLMGFIALFIGFAMVHHVFSLLIARQLKGLATLSALGVSIRRQMLVLFSLAATLGVVSSAIGSALGLLSGALLSIVTSSTVKNLYDSLVDASRFYWQPSDLFYGFMLGFLACFLGALHPIAKISSLPVAQVMRDGGFEAHQTGLTPRQAGGLALVIGIISVVCLKWTVVWNRIPITALVACLGFLVVSALAAQLFAHFLYTSEKLTHKSTRWLAQLRLFLPPQAAVVVQILTLTFTLTFGVKGMAESFRMTVSEWAQSALRADLWIRSLGGAGSSLPETVIRRLERARQDEALAIDSLTVLPAFMSTDNNKTEKPVLFANAHMNDQAIVAPMNLLLPEGATKQTQAQLATQISASAKDCAGTPDWPCLAYISEPIQVHFSIEYPLGKIVCPEVQSKPICFKVIAVYQDFGSDQGVILSDRSIYERLSGQRLVPSFANVYLRTDKLKEETSIERDLRKIVSESDGTLGLETLKELQGRILETFDNTFRVTDALYILCGIIAIVATVSSLNMQILLRKREWNIQWALGVSAQQLGRRFALWSAIMAMIAAAISILGGIVLSAVLVYAVNYYSFGYSLSLAIPWHLPVVLLLVATVSGFLAGWMQVRSLREILSSQSIAQE